MKCSKCKGFTTKEEALDDSYNIFTQRRCLNCGEVTFPKYKPLTDPGRKKWSRMKGKNQKKDCQR